MKRLLFLVLALASFSAFAYISSVSYTFSPPSAKVVDLSSGNLFHFPITVTVSAASGDTAKVEYSTTPGAAQNPGAAIWMPSVNLSSVTATERETLPSPITAIRFTTISGTGTDTAEIAWGY